MHSDLRKRLFWWYPSLKSGTGLSLNESRDAKHKIMITTDQLKQGNEKSLKGSQFRKVYVVCTKGDAAAYSNLRVGFG